MLAPDTNPSGAKEVSDSPLAPASHRRQPETKSRPKATHRSSILDTHDQGDAVATLERLLEDAKFARGRREAGLHSILPRLRHLSVFRTIDSIVIFQHTPSPATRATFSGSVGSVVWYVVPISPYPSLWYPFSSLGKVLPCCWALIPAPQSSTLGCPSRAQWAMRAFVGAVS